MKNSRLTLLLAIAIFSLISFSCTSNNDRSEAEKISEEHDDVVLLEADDENVKKAREAAQAELGAMETYYKNDTDQKLNIYLKAAFTENKEVEHMWGILLAISETEYTIRLDNEPYYVHNVALGDTLTIAKSEVEDFLVYEGENVLLGDFMNW